MKKEYRFNMWYEGLKILAGIIYFVASYSLIVYLGLGFWGLYVYLLCTGLLFSAIRKFKGFTFKGLIKNSVGLLLFLFLLRFFNSHFGIMGIFFGFAFLIGFILYSRRTQYMKVKWHIESMIWGKPIKDFINKGETLPKLKIKL